MILTIISYTSAAVAACFVTLCLASGLYYLAEFVEEYSVLSKKIITRTIQGVLVLHFLLLFEDLSLWRLCFSFGCHLVYSLLLVTFPVIQLTDPIFLLSCILAVSNHFIWFSFFTDVRSFKFSDIAGFYLFVVWLVPFMFFISLSAADNVLPNYDDASSKKSKFGNVVKNSIGWVLNKKDLILPPKPSGQKVL